MADQVERIVANGQHRSIPVRTTPNCLRADPRRVLAKLFVAGDEMLVGGQSRAAVVIDRVLAMGDAEAETTLEAISEAFAGRHRHLDDILDRHFSVVAHRLAKGVELSITRRRLLGAYFTQEYAVEAAALFNPSIVVHPCQDNLLPGQARFVMSLRAVGEGHRSSIEFRTGVMGSGGAIELDDPGPYLEAGAPVAAVHDRGLVQRVLDELAVRQRGHGVRHRLASGAIQPVRARSGADPPPLPPGHPPLGARDERPPRADRVLQLRRRVSRRLDDRRTGHLAPQPERDRRHGGRPLRAVRRRRREHAYYATYTAFDGHNIAPQLIETLDFRTFCVSQLTGPAAKNKGMALFPRRIDGRFVALSRSDRESIGIATSGDIHAWGETTIVESPIEPWELIQLGNCGSPIETPEGWLVLTHGVGPMRVYSMGAILLDLHDPTRIIGRLTRPWLTPSGARTRWVRPERRLLVRRADPRQHVGRSLREQ